MSRKVVEELLNDFNDIAVEARNSRSHGLTGQISGLFVSGQHKDVKEKAEAAQVALRDMADAADLEDACRECSVRLCPLHDLANCVALFLPTVSQRCNLPTYAAMCASQAAVLVLLLNKAFA